MATNILDTSLHRTFSGDAGGGFGGDGGILEKECSPRRQPLPPPPPPPLRPNHSTFSSSSSGIPDLEKNSGSSTPITNTEDVESSTWEVQWTANDPTNPRNLANWRKWICTWVVSSASLCVTCTSSIYTSTYTQLRTDFNVSQLAAVAGLSLFVMGLGIGPMFLGPLSEFYGRRPIYLTSFACFTLLLLPCALAPTLAVLLVFRFLTGMAGSAFLSVAGGTVGDMFSGPSLGAPMMIYTASPFVGPEVGPLIGGFINENMSWRWTFWIIMIWSGAELAALYFLVPETYHPVLLRARAVRRREESGEQRWYAPIEKTNRSIPRTVTLSCLRPFQLLMFEPMLTALCIFTALLLGVLYLFFQAFPLSFRTLHGFTLSEVGLTFLGLFIGMVAGILSDPIWRHIYSHLIILRAANSSSTDSSSSSSSNPQPEFRLPSAILGSVLVPIGIFWFAWTSSTNIHWIVPIIGSVFFGAGTLLVFSGVFTFLVDAYPLHAASALAANSFVRSSFAAGFPLFSGVLYERLGFGWAGSTLGFLTLPMAPVMVGFFWYGERIRGGSRYAGRRGD